MGDLELGQLIQDPSTSFDAIIASLDTMDPQRGMLYFASFYVLAEILAIPAVPLLTASSGYLFGTLPGTATCLLSAAIAASISFVIGRTLLRGYVETVLAENPKFQSMDRAIEKEGFKLMLLLRLSPLFPFTLSNYLYGASSIQFVPYFFGTLLGFGECVVHICCVLRRCHVPPFPVGDRPASLHLNHHLVRLFDASVRVLQLREHSRMCTRGA